MKQIANRLSTKFTSIHAAADALLVELRTRAAGKMVLVSDQGLAIPGSVQNCKEELSDGGMKSLKLSTFSQMFYQASASISKGLTDSHIFRLQIIEVEF